MPCYIHVCFCDPDFNHINHTHLLSLKRTTLVYHVSFLLHNVTHPSTHTYSGKLHYKWLQRCTYTSVVKWMNPNEQIDRVSTVQRLCQSTCRAYSRTDCLQHTNQALSGGVTTGRHTVSREAKRLRDHVSRCSRPRVSTIIGRNELKLLTRYDESFVRAASVNVSHRWS